MNPWRLLRDALRGPREQGFTLIELLVVIIIIGLLVSIAMPVFLNQRKKGVDATMKNDLKVTSEALEVSYTETFNYPATLTLAGQTVTAGTQVAYLSPGNVISYSLNTSGDAYCLRVARQSGAQPGSQDAWVWISDRGGLQPSGITTCPVGNAF